MPEPLHQFDLDLHTCGHCDKVLTAAADIGYDGPARHGLPYPSDENCSPLHGWLTLCQACALKVGVNT